MRIGGYSVVVVDGYTQKIKISSDFQWITESGRLDIDQWLADMFGFDKILDDEVIVDENTNTMYVTQWVYAALKTQDNEEIRNTPLDVGSFL